MLLVTVKGFGNAVKVDVFYDDVKMMEKRLGIIRASFPNGIENVGITSISETIVHGAPRIVEEDFEPFENDVLGQSLHVGELLGTMHPVSKQYVHASENITEEVRNIWTKKLTPQASAEDDPNNLAVNNQTPLGEQQRGVHGDNEERRDELGIWQDFSSISIINSNS